MKKSTAATTLNHEGKIAPIMKAFPPLRNAPAELLQFACETSSLTLLKHGSVLFEQDQKADCGYLVSQGLILLTRQHGTSHRYGVELVGAGEPFGILAVVGNMNFPLSAVAITDTVVATLPRNLISVMQKNIPEFSKYLLSLASDRFCHATDALAAMQSDCSKTRVLHALKIVSNKLKLAHRNSKTIPLCRKHLAMVAGITVETCIRVTKDLETNGIVAFPQNRVIEILRDEALA